MKSWLILAAVVLPFGSVLFLIVTFAGWVMRWHQARLRDRNIAKRYQ